MTLYHVTTPPYDAYADYFPEFGTGPTFTAVDSVEVHAETRRAAVSVAVRQWLDEDVKKAHWARGYCAERKSDGLNPFTGIRAKTDAEVRAETMAAGPPDWLPQDGWGPDATCDIDECRELARGWAWHDGPWREDESVTWGYFAACARHLRESEGRAVSGGGDRLNPRAGLGFVALAAYAGCVVLANWFIIHVGEQAFPGGPHTIPVGFGYRAPSGVLWIGLAFTVRDVVQSTLGKRAVVGAIVAGAVLSYFVAPSLAWASAVAFLVGEALDFAVYVPLIDRGRVLAAVVASNTVGLLVDTFLFLWLAFHSIQFWQGQVIGKAAMTALAVAVLIPWRRRLVPA